MITAGATLLQPQRVRRAATQDPLSTLVEDLLGLAVRVAGDPLGYEAAVLSLVPAVEGLAERLASRVSGGLAQAAGRVGGLLAPLADGGGGLAQALAGGDPAAVTAALLALLEQAAHLLESLAAPQLSRWLGIFLDALQGDLGLDGPYLEGQLWAAIDDMIAALEALPANGDPLAQEHGEEIASLLRRTRRLLRGLVSVPQWNADRLAGDLLALLQRSGAAAQLRRVACAGEDAAAVSAAAAALLRLVTPAGAPPPGPGPVAAGAPALALGAGPSLDAPAPAGAGKERYSWYGTWLLHGEDSLLFGFSEFKDAGQIATKVKSGDAALFGYLRQQVRAETRQLLDAYSAGQPDEALTLALLVDFNVLLQGPALYDEARFAGITLTSDTRDKIKEKPTGDDLVLLNRMLLEDAFGDAIDSLTRRWIVKRLKDLFNLFLTVTGWPGNRVWVDRDGKHVMFGDKPLHAGSDVKWHQAPIFNQDVDAGGRTHYVFARVTPDRMEEVTFVTGVAAEVPNFALHLLQIQPSHYASPVWFAAFDLGRAFTDAIAEKPLAGLFNRAYWLEWMLGAPAAVTALTAIEPRHPNADAGHQFTWWLGRFFGDQFSDYTAPQGKTGMVRDGLLAILTLLNFSQSLGIHALPKGPAENFKQVGPLVGPLNELAIYLMTLAVPHKDYGYKGLAKGNVIGIWLAAAGAVSILTTATACFTAMLLAGASWDTGLWLKTYGKSAGTIAVKFFLALKSGQGRTDGGKYNPLGADFAGYPAKSPTPSPYLLPYPAGETNPVSEGNQSMSSHNFLAAAEGQPVPVYAYSFATDYNVVILASRPGTVVDFVDNVDENSDTSYNFIRLRHDVDDAGSALPANDPQRQAHDRDAGGQVVTTFGVYSRGRKGGIADAFRLWQPAGALQAGTKVKRGMPLMMTGNDDATLYVQPGDGQPGPGGTTVWTPKNYTVPFVFQDVGTYKADADGVPASGNWYTSTNQQRTS